MTTTAISAADTGLPTIPELYERWLAAVDAYDSAAEADTGDALFKAYRAAEDELIATPAASLHDLAIKIVVTEDAGGHIAGGGRVGKELVAEARRLVAKGRDAE